MCVVALKYFDDVGWVGVKNRDRNYKPVVKIVQSFRGGIERMFIYDMKTKWSEGFNEKGISILSSAVSTNEDESESDLAAEAIRDEEVFYSPEGKMVRDALKEATLERAIEVCIEERLTGNTIIFDKDRAFLMESGINKETDEYTHVHREIPKNKFAVRTNHGIWIKWAGYQKVEGDEVTHINRESSEERFKVVKEHMEEIKDPFRMLEPLSISDASEKPGLNPLREYDNNAYTKNMKTTGQIMIIPSKMTLYYRPIFCEMDFDFNKTDSPATKTYFQILSARELLHSDQAKLANDLLLIAASI